MKTKINLEKTSSFGTIIAAVACPICFPKLALLGSLLGLGFLAKYEFYFLIAAQVLVVITFVIHVLTYKQYRNRKILALSVASALLFFIAFYVFANEYLAYMAFAGLIAASFWSARAKKQCSNCIRTSETGQYS